MLNVIKPTAYCEMPVSSVLTDEMTTQASVELGEQFTEIFVKKHENVSLLVSLLEVSSEIVCSLHFFMCSAVQIMFLLQNNLSSHTLWVRIGMFV